jgi:hypothetical protein
MTPSHVKQRKGGDEVSVSSSMKTPMTPKKHKGKEKVFKPIMESTKHVDFHFKVEWGCAFLDFPFEWVVERKKVASKP